MNFRGLHISISKRLIKLMIICSINEFEVCPGDVFWVLLNGSELKVFDFEKLLNYFHDKADFIITQSIKNQTWRSEYSNLKMKFTKGRNY